MFKNTYGDKKASDRDGGNNGEVETITTKLSKVEENLYYNHEQAKKELEELRKACNKVHEERTETNLVFGANNL